MPQLQLLRRSAGELINHCQFLERLIEIELFEQAGFLGCTCGGRGALIIGQCLGRDPLAILIVNTGGCGVRLRHELA